jgi:superoxide dismutase, Fe-Mn family
MECMPGRRPRFVIQLSIITPKTDHCQPGPRQGIRRRRQEIRALVRRRLPHVAEASSACYRLSLAFRRVAPYDPAGWFYLGITHASQEREQVMHDGKISRRRLLAVAAASAAAGPWLLSSRAWAASEKFVLPPLPWAQDALAPTISKETIFYHYTKHHATYVANLNKLVQGTPYESMTLEEIVQKAPAGPVFNNAAQVWNHTFYWNCMAPEAGGEPSGALAEAIEKSFGSFAKFREKFTETAVKLFGSGWAWPARNPDGSLVVVGTGNAGTPLKEGKTPLLTCDVWEHAYYIDYRNRRADYVKGFWKLVNWKAAEARLT